MVKSPEKKLRRQRWKMEKRRMRRRYAVLDTLPFPDAPLLLQIEQFFTCQDSFDLIYGPLVRAKQIAQQVRDLHAVLNEGCRGEANVALPASLPEIPSPRRICKLKVDFPMSLFDECSLPSRLYEHKVRSGAIIRADGPRWISLRHPHLLVLTGDKRLRGRLRRSEYLVRLKERTIDVYSLGYRPLFSYQLESQPPTFSRFHPDADHHTLPMLEPHKRAALIPTDSGAPWHLFLKSRYVESGHSAGKGASLAIVVQSIQQQSQLLADVTGLVELSSGSALPVVCAFVGQVNLETREFSIRQEQPQKLWNGQISENGRVMVLREAGQSKAINLVHEQTLGQLV